MKIVILHSALSAGAGSDEQDTLVAASAVREALRSAGRDASCAEFTLEWLAHLERGEVLVFNLVESVQGRGDLIYLAPGMLEAHRVPFAGNSAQVMLTTTHKTISKRIMRAAGIPTADWVDLENAAESAFFPGRYLFKPVSEDASIALDDESVLAVDTAGRMERELRERKAKSGLAIFAERYIEGREFNISMIGGREEVRVLPLAEMLFEDYPAGKPRIVNYTAKWDESSFEYRHTRRTFEAREEDRALRGELIDISKRCWQLFGLNGFARVDFRIDAEGRPWVLEINPNPGIAPDAGFVAAAAEAGMSFGEVVLEILKHPA